ncbi:MAG TPA: hypothetical protein VMH35_13880 [Streptosporangiaceae bacterium]|nr:hypothetical protein [Streptosporangiaceae bacterium]
MRARWPSRWWPGAGLLAAAGLLATACGAAPAPPAAAVTPDRAATQPATPAASTGSSPATAAPARAGGSPTLLPAPLPPGQLHQTRALPSAGTRVFHAEMTDLWAAVVTGQARLAIQAFFPLDAYTQVKAIYDPAADWHSRLFGDFRLDVAAAHHFLGRGPARARLLRVIVPSAGAAWIDPGVCYNSVGYWHVGGARLVYREHGQVRSIGIASLISWRGRWYVVHFGAVLRSGATGIVDQPAAGPGVPGPAGGC